MSYFDLPRLHFSGLFQADVSTINNEVSHYDNSQFNPDFQNPEKGGGWNPEGTGIFRFVDCRITGVQDRRGLVTYSDIEPCIGWKLENALDRAPGKLVDLDPQQQLVSEIWGWRIRLTDGVEPVIFGGDFRPAAFTALWRRQRTSQTADQTLAAVYTSILENVTWSGSARSSPALEALQRLCDRETLSIHMNVYGYGRDSENSRYTLGRVTGTIAPHRHHEPKHFALGRQLAPTSDTSPFEGTIEGVKRFFWFTCRVDEDASRVSADLGNALQIVHAEGPLVDNGRLFLAVSKSPLSTWIDEVVYKNIELLGEVDYRVPDWYAQTAGIVDFDLSPAQMSLVVERPLLLIRASDTDDARPGTKIWPTDETPFEVINQETLDGVYVRADQFVFRMNPGKQAELDLYATRWGRPFTQAVIRLESSLGLMSGGSSGADRPQRTPEINFPLSALGYKPLVSTDASGRAQVVFMSSQDGPGNPRHYIDGQLYGIGYRLTQESSQQRFIANNFVSLLLFDRNPPPSSPTWHRDIEPIFTQYGNLYPIMSRYVVDLSDYDAVCTRLDILKLAFSLPVTDPNYMPVTRDLSDDRRAMILHWLSHPLRGDPVPLLSRQPIDVEEPVPVDIDDDMRGTKSAVILAYLEREKHRKNQGGRS